MSSTITIVPEKETYPLILRDIQKEMSRIYLLYEDCLKQFNVNHHFKAVGYTELGKVVDLDISGYLTRKFIYWISDNVPIGAVGVNVCDLFPLWGVMETHRKANNLSFYYQVDLFSGGVKENKYLWNLVVIAIANLAKGVASFDAVTWINLQTVSSKEVEKILLQDCFNRDQT